jgi:hypothetical protein
MILPANAGVAATVLAAIAEATWLNKMAPSPKYQDDSRREDDDTSTCGAGGGKMPDVVNVSPAGGMLAVPRVASTGKTPPPCSSTSHLPEFTVCASAGDDAWAKAVSERTHIANRMRLGKGISVISLRP